MVYEADAGVRHADASCPEHIVPGGRFDRAMPDHGEHFGLRQERGSRRFWLRRAGVRYGRRSEELTNVLETRLAVGSGEETVVPDAMKAARQGVEKEASNELSGLERQGAMAGSAFAAIGGSGEAEDVGDLDRGPHRLSRTKPRRRGTGRAGRAG